MWRRQSTRNTPIDTIIGQHTRVRGKLVGSGGIIRIEGHLEGDVETDGMAVLGEGSSVDGDIHAHDVVIGGQLTGDVHAAGHLELLPTGHLQGTVMVGAIIIGNGAVFDGVCHIMGSGGRPAPAAEGETLPTSAATSPAMSSPAMSPPAARESAQAVTAGSPAPFGTDPGVPETAGAGASETSAQAPSGRLAPAAADTPGGLAGTYDAGSDARPSLAGDRPKEGTPLPPDAVPRRPPAAEPDADPAQTAAPAVEATLHEPTDGKPGFPLMPLLTDAPPGHRNSDGAPSGDDSRCDPKESAR